MFDVMFVTYNSMMTVPTQRVCNPPMYVAIPVLSVYVLYLFS